MWSFSTSSSAPSETILNSVKLSTDSAGDVTVHWGRRRTRTRRLRVVLQSIRPNGPFRNVVATASSGLVGVTLPSGGSGPSYYRVAARALPDCAGPH